MKPLKHVTFSIREDHVDLLNEISNRYSMRSRSAALSFIIEEFKRHEKIQAVKNAYHAATATHTAAQANHVVYVDTDSIKEIKSVDNSLCMYDHANEILEAMEDHGKDKEV